MFLLVPKCPPVYAPDNGDVEIKAEAVLSCDAGFTISGTRSASCDGKNGKDWDQELGECIKSDSGGAGGGGSGGGSASGFVAGLGPRRVKGRFPSVGFQKSLIYHRQVWLNSKRKGCKTFSPMHLYVGSFMQLLNAIQLEICLFSNYFDNLGLVG